MRTHQPPFSTISDAAKADTWSCRGVDNSPCPSDLLRTLYLSKITTAANRSKEGAGSAGAQGRVS